MKRKMIVYLIILVFTLAIPLADAFHFETTDFPEAMGTYVNSINDREQTVGHYWDSSYFRRAFLFGGAKFSSIAFPEDRCTYATGINNREQIVGHYWDNGNYHGFLLDRGSFSSIDFPEARWTYANSVNNRGQIVGYYVENNAGFLGVPHGFIAEQDSAAPTAFRSRSKAITTWARIKNR